MSSALRAALNPDVAFETPGFALADDLDWLDRLRGHRAAVAVVIHAARILEALAGRALELAGLAPPPPLREAPKMHHTLLQLKEYGHLRRDVYQLLDRLRDLGNVARHLRRRVSAADADQGYALALRAVHWYFCDFPAGPLLKVLTRHDRPLDDLLPHAAAELLRTLESAALAAGSVQTLGLDRPDCPLLVSPVLAAVLAERLLDRKRPDEAEAVLTAALARLPDDVRLQQLQGLLYSRTGRLQQACELLEGIGATDSAADEETLGILAGAYKRRAEAEPERREEWLRRSEGGYADGWRRSGGGNTYLGINAAALGLWLGAPGYAEVAGSVRDALLARQASLAPRPLTLWDVLTLAEAYLLVQDWQAAGQTYQVALRLHAREAGAIEVARAQARKHLEALGRPELEASLFDVSR